MDDPSDDAGQALRQQQPMIILGSDADRVEGRDARTDTVAAARALAHLVRTTLGPNGLDKMLVSPGGDVVVTNDAATILGEVDVEHPVAEMIVEVGEVQAEESGDGTTTAVTLAGELLARAEELIDEGFHPMTVVRGYQQAADVAVETIADLAAPVGPADEAVADVVRTTLGGAGVAPVHSTAILDDVAAAIRAVAGEDGEADADDVRVETLTGDGTGTELLSGLVCAGGPTHDGMPRHVDGATVAVVDDALELPAIDADVQYDVTTAEALRDLGDYEATALREYTDDIVEHAIDVVFATDEVADLVAADLANREVLALADVGNDDARAVAAATGANVVGRVRELAPSALGRAESISVETTDDGQAVYVRVAGTDVATVLVRGGIEHAAEQLSRAVESGVEAAFVTMEGDGAVPGGGATEIEIARALREHANGFGGREEHAIRAFADAVEVVPETLAENAGLDTVETGANLRAASARGEPVGVVSDGGTTRIDDPAAYGVSDAADAKAAAIRNATEATVMLARIDAVISADGPLARRPIRQDDDHECE